MTVITFNGPFGYDLDWDLSPIAAGTITESTETTVVIAFNGDETLTLTGTFSGGAPNTRPTDGTIDVITWNDTGESTVIETSITVADFFVYVDGNQGSALVAQLLAGDDTINGSAGNDSLIGLGGNDQISTGGGQDSINAGEDDDLIVLDGPVLAGSSLNGGPDSGIGNRDTLVVSMAAGTGPAFPGDLYSNIGLSGALSNVETIQFDTMAGQRLRAQVGTFQMEDIAALTGGAGSDQLQVLVLSNFTTTFVLDPLTLTNWSADDNVMLVGVSQTAVGTPPANFTLDSSAYSGQAVLVGGAGNDVLTTGAGNDFVLTNGGGADIVSTGAGNDTIIPQGSVTGSSFDGGADTDTANYSANSVGLTVNLIAGTATNGLNTDTLSGIENVTGSGHNDFLTGDGNANSLVGGDGSDTLIGHGGNDTIDGGALFDTAVFVLPSALTGTLQVVAGTSGKVNINRLDGGGFAEKLFEITPTGPGGANVTGFGSAAYHGTDTVTTTENLTFLMDGGNQANGRQVNALLSTLAVNNPPLFIGVVGSIGNDTIDLASYPGFEGLGFGSFGNDTITGTAGNNQLFGADGNDTLIGLGGDDLLNGGTGMNILQGGTENDILVVDAAFAGGSQFHGGDGTDTLRVHTIAGSPVTTYNFIGSPISSIERLLFQSAAGTGVTANFSLGFQSGPFSLPNQIGSGLAANAEIIGSAGFDTVQLTLSTSLVSENAGIRTLDLPQFTYTNWTAPARAYQLGDRSLLVAVGNDGLTINGSDHAGVQVIVGGGGNDIINGSDDIDLIAGGGGVNVLNGNGGDDALLAVNTFANGADPATATTDTFLGSQFNGGSGIDFLTVGGVVDFRGALDSIEGIHLQPAVTNTVPNTRSQVAAELTISGANWATLPPDLSLDGVGTIRVKLGEGQTFDLSGYVFEPGSAVDLQFLLYGTYSDGYIAGGTVFVDANGNYELDPGEPFAITDSNGNFELSSPVFGPLRGLGGTNTDTGLPNDLLLSAPEGSTVINPLTTLVQAIVETGVDSDTAQDQVKATLGLDDTIDLTTLDLIAAASAGDTDALDAQKAATSIAKILDTVIDSGGDPDAALETLASEIVKADTDGVTIDLADGNPDGILDTVFTDAGVPEDQIGSLITETQETIQDIQESETLDDISNVQAGDLVATNGSNGKDTLNGADSNDRLSGANGNDVLRGGKGSDLVLGGNGRDELRGDDGVDVLAGGRGTDSMWGGAGSDVFAFASGDSSEGDIIRDFLAGDKIYLTAGLTVASQAVSGGSTILSLSDGGKITLEGFANAGDHQDLLLAGPLPLWAQSWMIV